MLIRITTIAATCVAIYFALALALVFSQSSQERVGGASLDFARQADHATEAPPLRAYRTRAGDLGYRHFGPEAADDRPLVVMVHGSGWHGLAMVPLARELADRGLAEVLVPDLRGHGPAPARRGDIDHIGQLEEDLHDLIAAHARDGRRVVMLGHSSGGGLTIRYAGGPHGAELDGAILLAPYLGHDAPTTRPQSGGWARPLIRRIIGLSMLNNVGITALNHLPIIDFAFPASVLDGPLGATATRRYSYRLNTSFAPRAGYLDDITRLPPFLLIAGDRDEAFVAKAYEPTMAAANPAGRYEVIEGVSHLDILHHPDGIEAVARYLAEHVE